MDGVRKCALDVTEEGMLRKDDFFKVVFNPGSDKRGKADSRPGLPIGPKAE